MRETLRAERTAFNIEILGINNPFFNDPEANEWFTQSTGLCWLQDTKEKNVWAKWRATYRDVLILDYSNRVVGVYNLTVNDLSNAMNFEMLKKMFVDAANPPDVNKNKVPDAWEQYYLHGLGQKVTDDPDGDSYSSFLEFAFGTDPLDPSSFPILERSFNASRQFTISFNRWGGNMMDYMAEVSTNLMQWSSASSVVRNSTANLFDGKGRSSMRFNTVKNKTNQPNAVVRLNVRVRP